MPFCCDARRREPVDIVRESAGTYLREQHGRRLSQTWSVSQQFVQWLVAQNVASAKNEYKTRRVVVRVTLSASVCVCFSVTLVDLRERL